MEEKNIYNQLYQVIASIETAKDAELFFKDLCTMKEIDYMAQRVESAKLLMEGLTYQEVFKKVNISSATLSRVNKCVKYENGYKNVLKNLIDEQSR